MSRCRSALPGSRAVGLGLGFSLLIVPLAACGPMHAGAAATVGSARISVAQLDAVTARSLADPTFAKATTDLAALRTGKLQVLIKDRLLTAALAAKGLTVSEADLQAELRVVEQGNGSGPVQTEDQVYAGAAQGGLARADVRQALYDIVARAKLGTKVTTQVVHAAHILVKDKATADAILAQVQADPSQFAALAKSSSLDTGSAPNGGDLGTVPAATFVAPFAAALTKAAVGSYYVVQSSFGWHVVHLISRTSESVDELAKAATTQQEYDSSQAALDGYLGELGQQIGVSLNPRYGRWDATTAAITAGPDTFSSPLPSPGSAEATAAPASPTS